MGTVRSRSQKPAKSASNILPEKQPQAVARIVKEETGKIIRHLIDKLPPGAMDGGDWAASSLAAGSLAASLTEKLSRSIDRHYREIASHLAAAQDEAAVGARQTSAGLVQTLRSMGGSDTFSSGETAKPAGKKNAGDLEAHANKLLRQATGAAAFAGADSTVAVVKCRFRDNALKPKTVTDVKLAVNVTEPELISPDCYAYVEAQYLIKDLIGARIIESIDRRGAELVADADAVDGGEGFAALLAEIDGAYFDVSNVRGIIAQSAGLNNTRTGGFNMALNTLVALLDHAKLDYQCIENTRNGREVLIREYDDSDPTNLPDECYALGLRYLDEERLADDRTAYDAQRNSFEQETQLLWDLIEVNYRDSKPVFKVHDFDDLAKKNKGRLRSLLKRKSAATKVAAPVQEIAQAAVALAAAAKAAEPITVRFARMHERIKNMYDFLYPVERRIMEDRLAWLESESSRLDFQINPHRLRPGLLIDIEITSIKRRKTTQNAIASVLGDFLRGVYRCFQDAAAEVFYREKGRVNE